MIELTGNDGLVFEKAEYSYDELLKICGEITETYNSGSNDEKTRDILSSLVSWGVKDDINRVVVSVNGLSEEKTELLNEILSDNSAIVFKKI